MCQHTELVNSYSLIVGARILQDVNELFDISCIDLRL